jgi:hypothetical protein
MGALHAIGGITGLPVALLVIRYLNPTGHLIVFDLMRYIAPCLPRARLLLCQCLLGDLVSLKISTPLGSLKET